MNHEYEFIASDAHDERYGCSCGTWTSAEPHPIAFAAWEEHAKDAVYQEWVRDSSIVRFGQCTVDIKEGILYVCDHAFDMEKLSLDSDTDGRPIIFPESDGFQKVSE